MNRICLGVFLLMQITLMNLLFIWGLIRWYCGKFPPLMYKCTNSPSGVFTFTRCAGTYMYTPFTTEMLEILYLNAFTESIPNELHLQSLGTT